MWSSVNQVLGPISEATGPFGGTGGPLGRGGGIAGQFKRLFAFDPSTKPEDVELDAKTMPKLGGQFERFFHAAMADGSVRRIGRKAKEGALRLAIDPSDGRILNEDDLKP